MIRTTEAQITDAQNQVSKIIYFEMGPAVHDRINGIRRFIITSLVEVDPQLQSVDNCRQVDISDGNGGTTTVYLQAIRENAAIFKEATFMSLWGAYTVAAFEANVDQFMIQQIDYINSYTWTGDEAQAPVRFWSLTDQDLEIVT